MLLTNDKKATDKVCKWSKQAHENAPWCQHEELGYNNRMSNVIAGVVHGECNTLYVHEAGKSCPTEILETLASYNVEGRPIWKPMHMQPIYRMTPFVTRQGSGRAQTNAYIQGEAVDVGMDIFNRGLCLPSNIKMTPEQQDIVIAMIRSCFDV